MHDPKAFSLPNVPEGFIAQEGGAVGGRNVMIRGVTVWQQCSGNYVATQQVASNV